MRFVRSELDGVQDRDFLCGGRFNKAVICDLERQSSCANRNPNAASITEVLGATSLAGYLCSVALCEVGVYLRTCTKLDRPPLDSVSTVRVGGSTNLT